MPIPNPQRAHLQPPPARPRESALERKDRQLDMLRELADLNMLAARDAAHRIATRTDPDPAETPAGADPTLALARATRAITGIFNLESRIDAGETATAPASDDPRALALRRILHPLAEAEPDPVRRRALRQRLNGDIDDILGADLDDDLCLAQLGIAVAERNGLHLDVKRVADNYLFPISDPACTNPKARLTPFAPGGPPAFYADHPLPRGRPHTPDP